MHNHVVPRNGALASTASASGLITNRRLILCLVLAAMQASNNRPERTAWSNAYKIRIGMSANSVSGSGPGGFEARDLSLASRAELLACPQPNRL
jgi:hypothetical protein